MEKNKSRSDLRAAGQKTLQRFRQKKHDKGQGRNSNDKSTIRQHESELCVAKFDAVPQAPGGEIVSHVSSNLDAEMHLSEADAHGNDVDFSCSVAETDMPVSKGGEHYYEISRIGISDSHFIIDDIDGVDLEGEDGSRNKGVEEFTPAIHGDILGTSIDHARGKLLSDADDVAPIVSSPVDDVAPIEKLAPQSRPADGAMSLLEPIARADATNVEMMDRHFQPENCLLLMCVGQAESGLMKLAGTCELSCASPLGGDALAITCSQLMEAVKEGHGGDDCAFLLPKSLPGASSHTKMEVSTFDALVLFERVKEELFLADCTKGILHMQLAEQHALLTDRDRQLDQLKDEVSVLRCGLHEAHGSSEFLSKELAECGYELHNAVREKEEAQFQFLASRKEAGEASSRARQLQDKLDRSRSEVLVFSKELADSHDLAAALQLENDDLNQKLLLLSEEREKLAEENSLKNERLLDELTQHRDQVASLRMENAKLSVHLAKTTEAKEKLELENGHLAAQNDNLSLLPSDRGVLLQPLLAENASSIDGELHAVAETLSGDYGKKKKKKLLQLELEENLDLIFEENMYLCNCLLVYEEKMREIGSLSLGPRVLSDEREEDDQMISAIGMIDDLKEKLEIACKDQELLGNSQSGCDAGYRLYSRLRKLVDYYSSTLVAETPMQDEASLGAADHGKYESLADQLEDIMAQRLQLESAKKELELELKDKAEEIEELNRRCLDFSSVQKLIENLENVLEPWVNGSSGADMTAGLQLETMVPLLIRRHEEANMEIKSSREHLEVQTGELAETWEAVHLLAGSNLQHEIESIFLEVSCSGLAAACDSLLAAKSELLEKVAELQQPGRRPCSMRENSGCLTCEDLKQELGRKDDDVLEAEAKLRASESELACMRKSAAAVLGADAWREKAQQQAVSGDELQRRYDELEGKFCRLGEQTEVLEQSLVERDQLARRWEMLVSGANLPASLQSAGLEHKIEWMGNMVREADADRDSQLQKNLELEDDVDRLRGFICDALQDHDAADSVAGAGSLEGLEALLLKLTENYKTLSVLHSGLSPTLDPCLSKSPEADGEAIVDKLEKELEQTLNELAGMKEDRDECTDRCQALICQAESVNKQKGELQELLEKEQQRSAITRDKLNVAVRKGKSVVQQRDALKQAMEEMSAELEKMRSVVEHHENALAESELKAKDLTLLHSERIGVLEPENMALRNQLAQARHLLEERRETCGDLQAAMAALELESSKSRNATEQLVSELSEARSRNGRLQEDAAEAWAELARVSKEKDTAEMARLDALSDLEKLSSAFSEERKKQFPTLLMLNSGVNQLRKNFSDINYLLFNDLSKHLRFLQNMEAHLNVSEDDHVIDLPHLPASDETKFENMVNFGEVDISGYSGGDCIMRVCSSVQELLGGAGVLKKNWHELSVLVHEQATCASTSMGIFHKKLASLEESREIMRADLQQRELVGEERDCEIAAMRKNISLLQGACATLLAEAETKKAEVLAGGAAAGTSAVVAPPRAPFEGPDNAPSPEAMGAMAEALLSSIRELFALHSRAMEGKKRELQALAADSQQLREKSIEQERTCLELASQAKEAKAAAAGCSSDLQASTQLALDLSKKAAAQAQEMEALQALVGDLEASRGGLLRKLSVTLSKFDELHLFSEGLLSEMEKFQSQLQDRDSQISTLRQEALSFADHQLELAHALPPPPAAAAAQQVHKIGSADEVQEFLSWVDVQVSQVQLPGAVHDGGNRGLGRREVVERKVGSLLTELMDLRAMAQRSQPRGAGSHAHAASQVRSSRKVSNDEIAIAIDTAPGGTGRSSAEEEVEEDDDEKDKVHGFKRLAKLRAVPQLAWHVADSVDGLWVSCDRALMRRPALRLCIMAYWAVLHALLAVLVA